MRTMNPQPKKKSASRHTGLADNSGTQRSDSPGRKQRSDGAEARERLLHTALRLFAEKGFSKTSTREIAQAAGANIASISYYFGDKAGLYRAVYTEPMGSASDDIALYDQPHFTLRQSLEGFFSSFLKPMKPGDLVQLCMRLHFQEMLEPTGLWPKQIDCDIKPAHAALSAVLSRHLAIKKADDDVHRLAFSIAGLALQMFICHDVINAILPKLIGSPAAVDQWAERLVDYAEAMVAVEASRRKAAGNASSAGIKLVRKKKP